MFDDMGSDALRCINGLVDSMSFSEKVGQLNQRLYGWKCVERRGSKLVVTDYLKREIDRWGGLGWLYGLFRADPWSGRSWSNGIRPEERAEVAAMVQDVVRARGAHGVGVLLSEEAPHGHQALGGTVLPVNLALGATRDPDLVCEAQSAVASELALSGVHVALVSGFDIARDPRWGRCEECYGEDPHLAALMCKASVEGMQGCHRSRVGRGGIAVVMKHLAGQGEAIGGRNGQSAIIGERDLREIHLPPVAAAVHAGVVGVMAAYNDIDGVPCCANPKLLRTYLRDELGFDGVVMADGLAVDRLKGITGSYAAAGRVALRSGVDVSLWDRGFALLAEDDVDERCRVLVDASLRRVLELKAKFGLLPNMEGNVQVDRLEDTDAVHVVDGFCEDGLEEVEVSTDSSFVGKVADLQCAMAKTEELSRRLAEESLVELSGDPACVASRGDGPIVVTGPLADDTDCFLGDYTAPLPDGHRTTVYRELRRMWRGKRRVVLCGWSADENSGMDEQQEGCRGIPLSAEDLETLASASVVVQVVGGTSIRSYAEDFDANGAAGDAAASTATGGEGVDEACVDLPWHQDDMIRVVRHATTAPIVSVVVSGRAQVLDTLRRYSDRVIWAGYGGPWGPAAVAHAVCSEHDECGGRLPVTLPRVSGAVPLHYNDRQPAVGVYKDVPDPVLYGYGTGAPLSALSFESADVHADGDDWVIVLHLRNAGGNGGVRHGSLTLYAKHGGGCATPRLREQVASAFVRVPVVPQAVVVTMRVPRSVLFPDGGADAARLWLEGLSGSVEVGRVRADDMA